MSSWITHVKKVAKEKGIKYNEALKVAGKTYKKVKGMDSKKKKSGMKKSKTKKSKSKSKKEKMDLSTY